MKTLKELFDRDDVVELVDAELLKLMTEQPDFVYPNEEGSGCYYNTGPGDNQGKCDGCIFGQAFQRLGVPKIELSPEKVDAFLLSDFKSTNIGNFPKALPYWVRIQDAQDSGTKWGDLKDLLPVGGA